MSLAFPSKKHLCLYISRRKSDSPGFFGRGISCRDTFLAEIKLPTGKTLEFHEVRRTLPEVLCTVLSLRWYSLTSITYLTAKDVSRQRRTFPDNPFIFSMVALEMWVAGIAVCWKVCRLDISKKKVKTKNSLLNTIAQKERTIGNKIRKDNEIPSYASKIPLIIPASERKIISGYFLVVLMFLSILP